MKINMTKSAGGILMPSHDLDSEKLLRFKTGEMYEIDIKLSRNPSFHRKVFSFLNFCFEHYDYSLVKEFVSHSAQFDSFRSDLLILAGYYDTVQRINGDVKARAKSMSFANMEQDEFEQCYIALTNAAMKHIFRGADNNTYNKLIGFF